MALETTDREIGSDFACGEIRSTFLQHLYRLKVITGSVAADCCGSDGEDVWSLNCSQVMQEVQRQKIRFLETLGTKSTLQKKVQLYIYIAESPYYQYTRFKIGSVST